MKISSTENDTTSFTDFENTFEVAPPESFTRKKKVTFTTNNLRRRLVLKNATIQRMMTKYSSLLQRTSSSILFNNLLEDNVVKCNFFIKMK